MKKLALGLALGLFITGCATAPKISTEDRNRFNQTQTLLKAAPVTVIVDGCLLRSELGTDLIAGEQSRMTAKKFAEQLQTQLAEQGVNVHKTFTPFICGFMTEVQLKEYDFKSDSEAKRTAITNALLLNSDSQELTKSQKDTLVRLNQSINKYQALTIASAKTKQPFPEVLELTDDDVSILKDLVQSNYIFLGSITGVDASMGMHFAAGALSAGVTLATMGAGGNLVSSYIPKEGQHYVVYLINLENKKMDWIKGSQLKGRVYSVENHSLETKEILNPLFEVSTK